MKDPYTIPFVRKGFEPSDKATSFVEQNLEKLYSLYYGYQQHRVEFAYSEIILLKKGEDGFSNGWDSNNIKIRFRPEMYAVPSNLVGHKSDAECLFKALGKVRRKPNMDWENNISCRFYNRLYRKIYIYACIKISYIKIHNFTLSNKN